MAAWVWQGCHTLLICAHLCLSVGGTSPPGGSVCSAYSVGIFMFSHRFHGSAPMVRLCRFSHGIHRSHRITCCEEPPTEFTEFTELLAEKNLPRNSRNPQKLGCAIGCVGMAGMPYPPNLCASVPICGRHISARRFCVFRVFCGNIHVLPLISWIGTDG